MLVGVLHVSAPPEVLTPAQGLGTRWNPGEFCGFRFCCCCLCFSLLPFAVFTMHFSRYTTFNVHRTSVSRGLAAHSFRLRAVVHASIPCCICVRAVGEVGPKLADVVFALSSRSSSSPAATTQFMSSAPVTASFYRDYCTGN
jgi:hypothetical protein